jgi:hypothetical protein
MHSFMDREHGSIEHWFRCYWAGARVETDFRDRLDRQDI